MELKNALKEREELHQMAYKSIDKGLFLNEQTGEVYEPAQYTTNEDSILIKKAWHQETQKHEQSTWVY